MLAAVLVALVGQTLAQSSEYAITNCSDYTTVSGNNHHAYSYDCREYFNCDNNGGGKRVQCAAGTLFDREKFVCTATAACPSWDREVCFNNFNQRDASARRAYGSMCCNYYYEYSCGDNGAWEWKECAPNTQFDLNSRSCRANLNRQDCKACNTVPSAADMCTATHLLPVATDDCLYTVRGSSAEASRCARGTYFDVNACTCVRAVSADKCMIIGQQCTENDRSYLDFSAEKYMVGQSPRYVRLANGAFYQNQNSVQFSAENQFIEIYHFAGQTIGPNGAFRLTFTPSTTGTFGSTQTILSTGEPGQAVCAQGTRVTMTATRVGSNQVRVNFRVETLDSTTGATSNADISATVNSGNQPIQVLVVAQQDATAGVTIRGKVKSGGFATPMSGSATVLNYGTTNNNCAFQIGRFIGSLSEFIGWKCDNPDQLFNAFQ